MAPNESPMMHIVLDMHCKTVPTVDLDTIEYQVFKAKKKDELYVDLSSKKTRLIYLSVNFSRLMALHATLLACAAVMFTGVLTGVNPKSWMVNVRSKQDLPLAGSRLEDEVIGADLQGFHLEERRGLYGDVPLPVDNTESHRVCYVAA